MTVFTISTYLNCMEVNVIKYMRVATELLLVD